MNRVLVVDDDRDLCDLLVNYLQSEGFEVEMAHDGEQGIKRAISGEHALVVMDLVLPKMNGFEALRRIRNESQTPVIILTTRGEEADRIVGLEMGADDYIPKPFNLRELLARMRAILRRAKTNARESAIAYTRERLSIADIELDKSTRTVLRDGKPVLLTVVEFDLLEAMMRSAGRIATREELVKSVLGRNYASHDRSIDTHVANLRKKLGHQVGPVERIKTIRGIGYIYMYPNRVNQG